MPVTVFKRNEASATNTCDWSGTRCASFGKQLAEAFRAVGFLIARGETLTRQRGVAVCAREALAVPWLILVSYTTTGDDLVALNASSGKFILIAASAVDIVIPGDERLGANRRFTNAAAEAFLMPLASFVFHFLRSSSEYFSAAIAAGGKCGIVAIGAIDFLVLGTKWLIH